MAVLLFVVDNSYPKHKKKKPMKIGFSFVGLPGLEPGKAGPESAVLPLHHSPIISGAKVRQVLGIAKQFEIFFKIIAFILTKKGAQAMLALPFVSRERFFMPCGCSRPTTRQSPWCHTWRRLRPESRECERWHRAKRLRPCVRERPPP